MRVVVKYGGSSVATIEKITSIAKYISELKKEFNEIVVVASAMGKTTDELIKKAKEITPNPNTRELDSLLSTGEQQTVALLAMALNSIEIDAISLTGIQAGIKTVGIHTKSKIKSIDKDKLEKYLNENKVVIVAGFQGFDEFGDITTLGRGGSDTSAVALAATLGCECRIYTDVDGIYNVDPRLYPDAKRLEKISYEEMMEMAHLGAGVMETRAVEIGKKFGVPIFVGKSLSQEGGTYIVDKSFILEEKLVTGVSIRKEIIVTTTLNVVYSPNKVAKIFSILNNYGVNIDMIAQNIGKDNKFELSFSSIPSESYLLEKAIAEIKINFPEVMIEHRDNLSMLSLVGVGMINNSGIAGKFFTALSNENIEFYQITTSEISISCSIKREDLELAIKATAKEFNL